MSIHEPLHTPAASGRYIPARGVRERYSVSDMSLWRWTRDEALSFPKPLVINKRRFWRLDELEAWERSRAAGA